MSAEIEGGREGGREGAHTWVATPTGQVLRWHLRIMMQPIAIKGPVEKPNSSAPRRAATMTSRPAGREGGRGSWRKRGRKRGREGGREGEKGGRTGLELAVCLESDAGAEVVQD